MILHCLFCSGTGEGSIPLTWPGGFGIAFWSLPTQQLGNNDISLHLLHHTVCWLIPSIYWCDMVLMLADAYDLMLCYDVMWCDDGLYMISWWVVTLMWYDIDVIWYSCGMMWYDTELYLPVIFQLRLKRSQLQSQHEFLSLPFLKPITNTFGSFKKPRDFWKSVNRELHRFMMNL